MNWGRTKPPLSKNEGVLGSKKRRRNRSYFVCRGLPIEFNNRLLETTTVPVILTPLRRRTHTPMCTHTLSKYWCILLCCVFIYTSAANTIPPECSATRGRWCVRSFSKNNSTRRCVPCRPLSRARFGIRPPHVCTRQD